MSVFLKPFGKDHDVVLDWFDFHYENIKQIARLQLDNMMWAALDDIDQNWSQQFEG
jgi:hypothetical protein